MKKLLIIGASGHGKVVADIALQTGKYKNIVFFDDNEQIESVLGFPRKGKVQQIEQESRENEVVVAIGNVSIRERLIDWVQTLGFCLPALVHPKAILAEDVVLGVGTVVMAGAIINSDARIGNGVIVNTACSIDHDCLVEDYAHVSVGTHLAGMVRIGERSWIGAGAVVGNNISICDDVIVGTGAVVVKDITKPGTYVGVPARQVK